MAGQFYIVATPIGNLGDITLRAIEVLKSADYIACEDTRITKVLADKYDIGAKLFDCHKFNEKERSIKIIELLNSGCNVAFVSDAGTPCISDPGCILTDEIIKSGIKVTAIPGACAVSTFLSLVPRKTEEFAFIGFIPRIKTRRIELLKKYRYVNTVFYDSPNRLMETLEDISEEFGKDTKIAVARELTKIFEEVKIAPVEEIIEYYKENPLKGEIVVMVFAKEQQDFDEEDLAEKIEILKSEGFSQKDITRIITKLFGINKNKIYNLALKSK